VVEAKTVKAIGVSFTPQQLATLDAIQAANGGIGRSAAIRIVIERFVRQERALDLARAYLAGVVTAKEAMDQMAALVRVSTKAAAGQQ